MMIAGMIPAMADNGNVGSITISNAAMGETYTIYKLFDATVDHNDNTQVAYLKPANGIPEGLKAYFEEVPTNSGYVQAKPAAYTDVTYYTDATKATESATEYSAPERAPRPAELSSKTGVVGQGFRCR